MLTSKIVYPNTDDINSNISDYEFETYDTLDIMLDLETIGLCDNVVLTQISAVAFNMQKVKHKVPFDNYPIQKGSTLSEFNVHIDAKSCVANGLKVDGSTVEWWLKQPEDVINNVFVKAIMGGEGTYGLPVALESFKNWIDETKKKYKKKYVNVWGNGMLADNKWIRQAFKACSMPEPWQFYQDRDVRTIVELGKRIFQYDYKSVEFEGQKHNALDDCKHQIKYVCEIFDRLMRAAPIND